MPRTELETVYLAYLDALNDRRFADLDRFVHDELTYNDEALTRRSYADMIAADVRAVPDLRFEPRLLLTDGDTVACRLWFDCTPTGRFFGAEPTGRRVAFAEHVFYRFRAGRIAQVWSLIDREAATAAGPRPNSARHTRS
ncbi:ester cyclase [Actinacidiphila sp. DG2A-62]|uniref:ester cyclase n=1 Tax=Actinacidiphila sp. DG2A-62 TaxID=3108821 RepID=UPI002DBCE3E4|nr:ester cyclase [Actinacidiphila sp. DG2A-62]MEC3993200.1 ester cyclase [Actinacidiphila sp. DG2A-62]